ncbi:MAG TPA: ATP synthase F0 subunit C [Candidatus Avanaerovorax faecigallinarum]|nr:ATP synthase F0 subunit C [Candidatus Avanaerovorax faecigallinarum]
MGIIAIGAGIAVGLAALGIALGQGFGVGKAMEGISKQPEAAGNIRTTLIVGMAIMETMGVLSFVIAILMALKL